MMRVVVLMVMALLLSLACPEVRAQSSVRELVDSARKKWDAGDEKGALSDLDRAVALEPKQARLYQLRGLFKLLLDDFDGALADYNRAIALEPKKAAHYVGRGGAYSRKGEIPKAIADFDRAIALDPKLITAYLYRGDAKEASGDLDGALADFERAIKLDPQGIQGLLSCASLRSTRREYDRALEDYTRLLSLEPENAMAFLGRGEVKIYTGDLKGAIADLTRVVELSEGVEKGDALATRAEAKVRKGDLSGARADLKQALELAADDADLAFDCYTERARMFALLDNKELALKDLKKAHELVQGEPYAPLWLAGLGGGAAALETVDPEEVEEDFIRHVLAHYRGKLSAKELLAKAEQPKTERERNECLCEAHLFLGLKAELAGDPAGARKHYEAVVATGVVEYSEYVWAKARLKKLKR